MIKQVVKPKVIILDIIETIVSVDGIKDSVSKLLGNRKELGEAWYNTMLLYAQVDTLTNEYHELWKIASAAFEMVAQSNHIEFDQGEAFGLLKRFNASPAYSDVASSFSDLKSMGYKLVILANSSRAGIHQLLSTNNLEQYIDKSISTDDIGYFKPHPHTYLTAARMLSVTPQECLLITSHGWDVAGATKVGMKTAFVNRDQYALYPLAPKPLFNERNMTNLVEKIRLL